MFLPIKEVVQEITPEQREKMYSDRIMFDSHRWVEFSGEYFTCDFCGSSRTSSMDISVSICKENSHLKFKSSVCYD